MPEYYRNTSAEKSAFLSGIAEERRRSGIRWLVLVSLGLAILTGLSAQVRIPLPVSPVPVTGQVFVVLLIGFLFGKKLGLGSQIAYAGLGSLGIPWFAGMAGGLTVLAGPTGGYILGFLPAVYLIGWLGDNFDSKSYLARFLIGLAGLVTIYCFGAAQLSLFLNLSPLKTLELGVLPFIWVDLIKVLVLSVTVEWFSSVD